MKQKVLYIISYKYLSIPIFTELAKIFPTEYENILIHFEEPFLNQEIKSSDIEQGVFSEFIIVGGKEIDRVKHIIKAKNILVNIISFIDNLKHYKRKTHDVLNQISPDVIVSTTDSSFVARIIDDYAETNKIPFIVFQPSFIDPLEVSNWKKLRNDFLHILFNKIIRLPLFNKQPYWGNETTYAYIFLWGERFSQFIGRKDKIRFVGNPLLKKYFLIDRTAGLGIKSHLGIENAKKVITICTEGFNGMIDESMINQIYYKTIKSNPDKIFIIKVHPRDKIEFYKEYFDEKELKNILVLRDMPLLDIYSFTDVQISVNSYASVEAILCSIPVILVKRGLVKLNNYFTDDVTIDTENSEELTMAIHKSLTENYRNIFYKKRRTFLINTFGSIDTCESNNHIYISIMEIIGN